MTDRQLENSSDSLARVPEFRQHSTSPELPGVSGIGIGHKTSEGLAFEANGGSGEEKPFNSHTGAFLLQSRV
jgi:hypothetical protein